MKELKEIPPALIREGDDSLIIENAKTNPNSKIPENKDKKNYTPISSDRMNEEEN